MFSLVGLFLLSSATVITGRDFVEVLSWKQLTYDCGTNSVEPFNQYNNVPLGAVHHRGRLFVTVPRMDSGVLSTLNVIDLKSLSPANKSPTLKPYPSSGFNSLSPNYAADPNRIVSVFRARVDKCDRLWFVDTGCLSYLPNQQIQRPSIWVIDLNTNTRIRRFEIPVQIAPDGCGLASITLDFLDQPCSQTYAYLADWTQAKVLVYGYAENRIWQFKDDYFGHEPGQTNLYVAGLKIHWDDRVFTISVGARNPSGGDRNVYVHSMMSTGQLLISSQVLRNETLANSGADIHFLITHMGSRGPQLQNACTHYDADTGVLFYSEIQRNSVGCWNTKSPFTPDTQGIVDLDNEALIYPSDLNADRDGMMWLLTNRLPIYLHSTMDTTATNFRLLRQTPKNLIERTVCDYKW